MKFKEVAILGDGLFGLSLKDEMPEATVFGHRDLDVTKQDSLYRLRDFKLVVNTVAFHALMDCEKYPEKARMVNAVGARNVASLVPTIYISTDYVFNDGGPHSEVTPKDKPRSVYGRTKLAGERETLAAGGIVVRVAGLYGHHRSHKGPTFPERILSARGTLRLPTDQVFSPTYAPHAAKRVAELVKDWHLGVVYSGTYHATNQGSTSWFDFGRLIAAQAHRKVKFESFEAEDPLRPNNSALRSNRREPLPHWALAVDEWWRKQRGF